MFKRAHPEIVFNGTRGLVANYVQDAAQRAGWVLQKPPSWRRREWKLTFTPEASRLRVNGKLWVRLAEPRRGQTAVTIQARALTRALVKRALRGVVDELYQPTIEPRAAALNPRLGERLTTRVVVTVAVTGAVLTALLLRTPVRCAEANALVHGPRCDTGKVAVPDLPSFAFGQPLIYHVEIAVIVFFAALLIVTPAVAAISRGELPLEMSTQGFKFDKVKIADRRTQERIRNLEDRLSLIEPGALRGGLQPESPATHTGARREE